MRVVIPFAHNEDINSDDFDLHSYISLNNVESCRANVSLFCDHLDVAEFPLLHIYIASGYWNAFKQFRGNI